MPAHEPEAGTTDANKIWSLPHDTYNRMDSRGLGLSAKWWRKESVVRAHVGKGRLAGEGNML